MLPIVQDFIGDVPGKYRLVMGSELIFRESTGIETIATGYGLQRWYVARCTIEPRGYLEIPYGHESLHRTSHCLVLAYSLIHSIFHYARCKGHPP
jgi:hypothetical protein